MTYFSMRDGEMADRIWGTEDAALNNRMLTLEEGHTYETKSNQQPTNSLKAVQGRKNTIFLHPSKFLAKDPVTKERQTRKKHTCLFNMFYMTWEPS